MRTTGYSRRCDHQSRTGKIGVVGIEPTQSTEPWGLNPIHFPIWYTPEITV